jgi:hypothetical protein
MNSYWDALSAACDGAITPQDFESAAYRLVTEQCLYYHDHRSRTAYGIVEHYEKELAKALAPLGLVLKVNRIAHYAVAIPTHTRATPASAAQTLFALVLRGVFETMATAGYVNDAGEVHIDVFELHDKYRLMTGKEFPGVGEFRGLMRVMQRWGIARELGDDEASGAGDLACGGIAIRPGIIEVLGETALRRLALWQASKTSNQEAGDTDEVPNTAEEREVSDEAA